MSERFLDACALIALLRLEPGAEETKASFQDGGVSMLSINLAEAVDVLGRVFEAPSEPIRTAIGSMVGNGLTVRDLDQAIAWEAGELRNTHYHHSRLPVSIADCALLAAAKDGCVVTSDGPVLKLASKLGVEIVPIKNSKGRIQR